MGEIGGRMGFHFVMVLVGLAGSVNHSSQTRARLLPTHRVEAFVGGVLLTEISLQLQTIHGF